MLPVVAGIVETRKSIFLYTFLVIAVTLMLYSTRTLGLIYLVSSLTLGAIWIYYAWRLMRRPGIEGAKAAYLYSLLYLALIFLVIIIDSSVRI
jgi:protoheme IX farnesyltransferase